MAEHLESRDGQHLRAADDILGLPPGTVEKLTYELLADVYRAWWEYGTRYAFVSAHRLRDALPRPAGPLDHLADALANVERARSRREASGG